MDGDGWRLAMDGVASRWSHCSQPNWQIDIEDKGDSVFRAGNSNLEPSVPILYQGEKGLFCAQTAHRRRHRAGADAVATLCGFAGDLRSTGDIGQARGPLTRAHGHFSNAWLQVGDLQLRRLARALLTRDSLMSDRLAMATWQAVGA